MAFMGLNAQTIICEKQGSTAAQLGEGHAAVSFVSSQPDWIIKPIKGDSEQPRTKTSDGKKFVYEFRMDVSKDHERTYILGRKGSAITDQCVVKSLRPGIRVTFNLEEQADTLHRIEAQLGASPGVYPIEGKACVEITTSVKGLTVATDWPLEESVSSNGARIINVIVNIAELRQLELKRDSLSAVMKKLEDTDDYENMEVVMKATDELDKKYNACAELTIGGKGIKGIPIQLTDLSMKEKRRYAVVSISETFETFLSNARDLFASYPSHTESSYYDQAKIVYEKAINHNDCPPSLRDSLRNEYKIMSSLRNKTYLVEASEAKANKAEKDYGFNNEGVFKYLVGAVKFANAILTSNPEITGYNDIKERLENRMKEHPLNKVKSGETVIMHKRETVSGKVSFKNPYMKIAFDKMRVFATSSPKIQEGQSRIVGKVNTDGTYSIVKPDGMDILYLYVTGEKDNAHYVAPGTTELNIIVK